MAEATGAVPATNAQAGTNLQPVYISEKNKIMDISANTLLKDFIQFYEKRKKNKEFTNEDKYKTLIITLGAAQHDSPNNQLMHLLKMLTTNEKMKKNPKLFLHFDSEWDKDSPRHYIKKKRSKNLSNIIQYHEEKLNSYNEDIRDVFFLADFDDYLFPNMKNVDIPENRKKFMIEHLIENPPAGMHLFIPYDLISYYNDHAYTRRMFVISKKTFAEFGKGCPPVPGSTYDTLNQFIQKEKFEQIIIYNCAYWDSRGIPVFNNKGTIIGATSLLQNRYFEQMCELLNIVLNAGESVEKYIFETEFYRKLDENSYSHKNARNILSFNTRRKIGKLYPLNQTTSFAGGKRKTKKQRKALIKKTKTK